MASKLREKAPFSLLQAVDPSGKGSATRV